MMVGEVLEFLNLLHYLLLSRVASVLLRLCKHACHLREFLDRCFQFFHSKSNLGQLADYCQRLAIGFFFDH